MNTSRIRKVGASAIMASLLALTPSTLQASVLDIPIFNILGLVIVWGADTSDASPIASDFVLMTAASGTAGNDIIAGDVRPVMTGSLTAIPTTVTAGQGTLIDITNAASGGVLTDNAPTGFLDAGDSLTAFGLNTTTDVELLSTAQQHSFYVASNTDFDIQATSAAAVSTGFTPALTNADITFAMAMDQTGNDGLAYGSQAAAPATIGTFTGGLADLTDLSGGTIVFNGLAGTAAGVGSIADQSVRFDATYELQPGGAPYDLSQGAGSLTSQVTYTIFVP